MHTLNPAYLLLIARASPTLFEAIRETVDRYAHRRPPSLRVVSGHFGPRAELMGSLALAINRAADPAT